jgi:NAD(P)-dependent dehydrogenase (short-subunit alcohol dehydrogenase family)
MSENVALITGGAKGIGHGIALDPAARQWKMAICYRTSEAEAEKTAQASTVDAKRLNNEQSFSNQAAGTLQLLAKRLKTRSD